MSPSRAARLLLPVIYLGFVSLGLPDGTVGVAWPQAHLDLQLPVGLAGVLLLVVTLLAAVSGFSSGRIVRRFSTGPVVMASCALSGAGLLLLSRSTHLAVLLAACVPIGLGAGAVDAGLNGYVARHYSGRQMNWLHACWGIGATCGPLVIAHGLTTSAGWRGGYVELAFAQIALSLLMLTTLGWWTAVPERSMSDVATQRLQAERTDNGGAVNHPTMTANSAGGWLSIFIFALYVGTETTAGLWASSILVESRGISKPVAGICAAAYFGAITGGRVLTGCVVDRWGNRRLVHLGGVLALAGAALFVFARSLPLDATALVILAAIFHTRRDFSIFRADGCERNGSAV